MAQNVYSLNVVGYVNIQLTEGFNMIANPLDLDGYGTNNTVTTVLSTNLPVNSKVYTWNISTLAYDTATFGKTKTWAPDIKLNPGQGAWLSIPAGLFGGLTQNVTTVGTVLQGNLANPNIPAAGGFTLIGSQIPIKGGLTTTLGYTPSQVNEKVYAWPLGATAFSSYTWSKTKTWSPSEPEIDVGQGFWLSTLGGSVWTTNFTVP